ncbi:Lysosomal alpha-glucosidase [Trichoplax sp. H2]|nr:Lysosomal alpha-glucosidase [Trichoplax sp. H2]|eukprot:RDD41921.1 Lysosomal alpha-glucosidase [Trichoplax sp. H2]
MLQFTDNARKRYEVPIDFPTMNTNDQAATNRLYEVEVKTDPFAIIVKRRSTNTVIFDSSVSGFIFEDQFLEISSKLPSIYFYGLGEHEHQSLAHSNWNWHRWGMFSRDEFPGPNRNLYGVHPMYLNVEDADGNSNVVLLVNSNAMEAVLTPLPGITWRTIGGILDFYVFLGPSPANAVSQYIKTIGLPYFPPYWSLGFQLCRWGYNSLDRVKQVVEDMRAADIPMDVQYGDLDYMKYQLDFTYDPVRYDGLPAFVDELHSRGQKYIIILDPAISDNQTSGTYPPYDDGAKRDIFIRHADNRVMVGKVWPRGNAVFPDYTSESGRTWWKNLIVDFHNTIKFDGLWIDMNEPANFVPGSVVGCPNDRYNNPPYMPKGIKGNNLYEKTLCMDGKQAWGTHYDVHSLYGYSEIQPTLEGCRNATGKRGMVISRSTFVGGGKESGHWLGDNWSGWPPMAYSIVGSLEFNMFGIPYIGADICGFFNNATASLCNRWMQLGAFYTFARNHNGNGFLPQHPPAFGAQNAANARKVLLTRYRLLPYLYTLFFEAATEGKTVMRSLMMEFPRDITARTISRQFLWGSALLITPVLEDNANSVYGYFPSGRWFDYYTGVELVRPPNGNVSLNAPADYIPLHMRGGSIMVVQEPANTTVFARRNQFTIIIAIGANNFAEGSFFWDDGDSAETIKNENYTYMTMNATQNTLTVTMVKNNYPITPTLKNILVYGITVSNIVSVSVGGEFKNHVFNANTRVLNITGINGASLNYNMNGRGFTATYKAFL